MLFVPAPEPEAEPAVASENTAAASPPADEAAPAPASPVSPQGGQSLGSKLGAAAKGDYTWVHQEVLRRAEWALRPMDPG